MSTFRNPVGPQPSTVYWRRRLVLILGALAVIIVIVLIVVGSGRGDDKPTAGDTKTPAASDTETDAPVDDSTKCDPAAVVVEAITDKTAYAAGEQPQLSMSLTNNGAAACTFEAGSDVQLYAITSGPDEIWNSKDCQTAPVAAPTVLQPGEPVTSAPFAWDRTRSSATTCETARQEVAAGGGYYNLKITVNGVESAAKQFQLN